MRPFRVAVVFATKRLKALRISEEAGETKQRITVICLVMLALIARPGTLFAGEDVVLRDKYGRPLQPSRMSQVSIEKTCGDCHEVGERTKSLHFNKGEAKPDPDSSECLTCHLPKTRSFNAAGHITKTVVVKNSSQCAECHSDVASDLAECAHGKPDQQPGDHPSCGSCHGSDPHAIKPIQGMSKRQKAQLCISCHADAARMGRYKVDPDAVSSYEHSFHGRGLMRFNEVKSAGCTDCHGYHSVLPSSDHASPTNAANVAKTCGQCHMGAGRNFSVSGATHMRLKIEQALPLRLEDVFFRALLTGTMAFLLALIGLDLRRKVFATNRPQSGKLVATLVALGFLAVTVALVLGSLHIEGAEWAMVACISALVSSFVLYYARGKHKRRRREKQYQRLSLSQRAQHICLAVSFTVLVLTGMPLKYAGVGWSEYLYLLFGGFEGARIAHRAAAVLLTATWIWHFFFLVYRWKKAGFSLRAWSMWPTRKDFADFWGTVKYGLSLQKQQPAFDRFHFREKFDYFAVYWGMPVMVFSGAVLWFPVFFGNRLPELAIGMAYIAHSEEALLAFLAIAIWHMYNVHLDPEHFPMSQTWYNGVVTESHMKREHPLEKKRMDALESREPSIES
jgi:formate dehydrogenase subunit gamma